MLLGLSRSRFRPKRTAAAKSAAGRAELLSSAIARVEATLRPKSLRTLDAIHLATMLSVRDELEGVVVYDRDLADAVRGEGLEALAPGA